MSGTFPPSWVRCARECRGSCGRNQAPNYREGGGRKREHGLINRQVYCIRVRLDCMSCVCVCVCVCVCACVRVSIYLLPLRAFLGVMTLSVCWHCCFQSKKRFLWSTVNACITQGGESGRGDTITHTQSKTNSINQPNSQPLLSLPLSNHTTYCNADSTDPYTLTT